METDNLQNDLVVSKLNSIDFIRILFRRSSTGRVWPDRERSQRVSQRGSVWLPRLRKAAARAQSAQCRNRRRNGHAEADLGQMFTGIDKTLL
jgi:hypothetical protein